MDQILSNSEVDALLSAMKEGELEIDEQGPEKLASVDDSVQLYDLTNKERSYRGNLPGFEIINDRFAKRVKATLTRAMRQPCDVQLMSTETIRYEDFIMQASRPVAVHLFKVKPLPGMMGLSMDASLVFGAVDMMCGSTEVQSLTGPAVKLLNRDFTTIELKVVSRLAKSMSDDLASAFGVITKAEAQYVRSETRPELAGIALDTESVLYSVFELNIGRHKRLLGSVVPLSMLDPIKSSLLHTRTEGKSEPDASGLLSGHLLDTLVDVTVVFGQARIDLRTLLNLEEGDTIRLGSSAEGPLSVCIEGTPKYRGNMLTINSQLAIRLNE